MKIDQEKLEAVIKEEFREMSKGIFESGRICIGKIGTIRIILETTRDPDEDMEPHDTYGDCIVGGK